MSKRKDWFILGEAEKGARKGLYDKNGICIPYTLKQAQKVQNLTDHGHMMIYKLVPIRRPKS